MVLVSAAFLTVKERAQKKAEREKHVQFLKTERDKRLKRDLPEPLVATGVDEPKFTLRDTSFPLSHSGSPILPSYIQEDTSKTINMVAGLDSYMEEIKERQKHYDEKVQAIPSLADRTRELTQENLEFDLALYKDKPLILKQKGSFISGYGSGDKVPALLEPGEFVLNRNAVGVLGAGKLENFNKKHARFQKGGAVKMQTGGGVSDFGPGISLMNTVVQQFGAHVDKLVDFSNNINGLAIELNARHTVEVIINGAQVLQQLQPSIENLVISATNQAINNMLDKKFNLPPLNE